MFILNTLVQIVGVGSGIYLMITVGFARGALLILIITVLHFVFSFCKRRSNNGPLRRPPSAAAGGVKFRHL